MPTLAFTLTLREDIDRVAFHQAIVDGLGEGLEQVKEIAAGSVPPRFRDDVAAVVNDDASSGIVVGQLGAKGQDAYILNFFEVGVAAHVIRPDPGKFLVFQIDGRTIFTRKVAHPGMPPRPWLEPALRTGLPMLEEAVAASIRAQLEASKVAA